jgi:tetratricopeptide (TPR) repeat protein
VAQQIALREQAKAVVDGSVTKVDNTYIVVARLVTADSARELTSYRETASSADGIIDAADRLSRKLRAAAGESLRQVQATPRLAYATTSSLDALRKYSEASRANDVERDFPKAIRLLREAVALDSSFAEGWRKLAVAIRNSNSYAPSVGDSAIRRAFQLSGRMTERERDAVLGYYYSQAPGYDREKAIAAYRRMLARGDSIVALVNLGVLYNGRREYAKAESLYRVAIKLQPENQTPYTNLLFPLASLGKMGSADSLAADIAKRFPKSTGAGMSTILVASASGRWDDALAKLDSARKVGDARAPTWAVNQTADIYVSRGRLKDAEEMVWRGFAIDSARGAPRPRWLVAGTVVDGRLQAGVSVEAALKRLDAEIAQVNFEKAPLPDRPYLWLARLNARAGRLDQAKAFVARYDAAIAADTALKRWETPEHQQTESDIAAAERRWADAARLARAADRRPDGPVNDCEDCTASNLMRIFGAAGMADSLIATYEAYRATGWGGRERTGPDVAIGPDLLEAVGRAYESVGNSTKALEAYRDFVDAWKPADQELQPRVAAVRERIRQLSSVEGRKP